MDPTRRPSSHALRRIVCHLLVRHYRELIAYGAGWTDPERQQPVGDTGRHEPRQLDAIIDAELERALDDPDPLRGIAQLAARLGAAFVLDPAGVTRTKALGSERMARKLRDALPGGDRALRAARVGVHAPDALARAGRAQPRRVRHRRRASRPPSTSTATARRPTSTSSPSTTSQTPRQRRARCRPPSSRPGPSASGGRTVVGANSPSPLFWRRGRSSTSDRYASHAIDRLRNPTGGHRYGRRALDPAPWTCLPPSRARLLPPGAGVQE